MNDDVLAEIKEALAEIEERSGNVRVRDMADYDGESMPRAVSVAQLVAEICRLRLENRLLRMWNDANLAKVGRD